MADPTDTGEPAGAVIAARAPEGAAPGGLAAVTESMVVTVVGYDRDTGLATFRTPDGFTRRTVVPPELRNFASTKGPGLARAGDDDPGGGRLGHRAAGGLSRRAPSARPRTVRRRSGHAAAPVE